MSEDLVSEALRRALVVRRPAPRPGSPGTPTRAASTRPPASSTCWPVQRMSRRSNWYDNAHAESFWNRFEAELLAGGFFPGRAEAKLESSRHVAYYKAGRHHAGLLGPNHCETHL